MIPSGTEPEERQPQSDCLLSCLLISLSTRRLNTGARPGLWAFADNGANFGRGHSTDDSSVLAVLSSCRCLSSTFETPV